jgi:glycosyltransferase involved in cell wall biosynthesis
MTKRILVNVMLFGPGGGETHLLHLCSLLTKQGAEITLLTRYAHESTPLLRLRREIPIRIVSTPFARNRRLYRLSTAWALLVWPALLGRKRYDLLYTWELSAFTRFLSFFVLPRGHIILQRIGEPLSEDFSLGAAQEGLLDGLVVETSIHAQAARRVLRRDIAILALPLIGHCVTPRASDEGPSKGMIRVAFLGRYHRDKGIYRLLEIWSRLNIAPARLNFYGWGSEYEQLSQMVQRLRLQRDVHLNGSYSTAEELSGILAVTDLVVLPSETEGLPVVLLEAMAHGVPFVATDVGAVRLLADQNPDVRVVPLDNHALKDAIEEIVQAIRSGRVQPRRLQAYYQARYGYEVLGRQWTEALLHAERTWKSQPAA